MKKRELVRIWIETLTKEQLAKALEITVVRLIETEDIGILEEDRGPYWTSCGEGILESED